MSRLSPRALWRVRRGATLVEYGTILALIFLAGVTTLLFFGTELRRSIEALVPALAGETPGAMVVVFDTTLTGGTTEMVLGAGADVEIDWDVARAIDVPGCPAEVSGPGPHFCDYGTPGVYEVAITGTSATFAATQQNLTRVVSFGEIGLTSLDGAFSGSPIVDVPPELPSGVTNLQGTFISATSFNDPDIAQWDVSNVDNMITMFSNATAFDVDLAGWDMSSVTAVDAMFNLASDFNGDVSGWDLSSLTSAPAMFAEATSFNGDLSDWCVPLVATAPVAFDLNTPAWTAPRPAWGTCP